MVLLHAHCVQAPNVETKEGIPNTKNDVIDFATVFGHGLDSLCFLANVNRNLFISCYYT